MVKVLIISKVGQNQEICWSVGAKRIIRYTPAVTKVEECTSAETGVGAAIAIGSQGENGNCALLVIAASKVAKRRGIEGVKSGMFQWAVEIVAAIPAISAMSPIRFVRAVIIPAPRVEGV